MEGGNALNNATTELAKAYYAFFSQYTLPDGSAVPAYPDGMVPTGTNPPYVTYQIVKPAPLATALLVVRVWAISTSVTTPYTYIVDQVEDSIPFPGGARIRLPDGLSSVKLERHSAFSQDQPSDEENLKIRYLNLEATYYGIN